MVALMALLVTLAHASPCEEEALPAQDLPAGDFEDLLDELWEC